MSDQEALRKAYERVEECKRELQAALKSGNNVAYDYWESALDHARIVLKEAQQP
jgi:predicted S18 family serine protease